MALARDPTPHDQLGMGSLQQSAGCLIYGNGNVQGVSDHSLPDHDSEKTTSTTAGIVKSPPSVWPQPPMIHYQPREAHSVITFRPGRHENFTHNSGSLLSFEGYDTRTKVSHEEDHSNWEDNLNYTTYQNHLMNPRVLEDFNCFPAGDYGSIVAVTTAAASKENQQGEESSLGWLYTEATTVTDSIQESATRKESCFNKRPHVGDRMQGLKRQCTVAARKPKATSVPSKDPQSIAAKNRRERISERLKILQDLVPNGSKVDLVTMLEKAISYVKFLQLQVKVLATDEFWPVQGGKAPDISQVKEAIDAILNSQRDSNSRSK